MAIAAIGLVWLNQQGLRREVRGIRAELEADGERQDDLARRLGIPPPRDGDDDPPRRHLRPLAVVVPISAAASWAARQATEHPARTGMALTALTAALITPMHSPKPHFNGGPEPLPNITAPVTPTQTPKPSEPPHRRNTPTVPPASEGPGQSLPAGPTNAPAPIGTPHRSVPVPHPSSTPTALVTVPSLTESVSPPETSPPTATSSAPPTTPPPPSSPPPPTPPPTGHPANHCLIGANLLGIVRVCVGAATGPPGPTTP